MRWKSFSCASHPLVASLNASCLKVSNSGRSLVMGDKQGAIKLFPFPPTSAGAHVSHNYDKNFCLKKSTILLWPLNLKLLKESKFQIFNLILVLWSFCEYTVSLLDLEWRILCFCWRRGPFSFCLGDKQRIIICTKALIFKFLPRPDQLFLQFWPLISDFIPFSAIFLFKIINLWHVLVF